MTKNGWHQKAHAALNCLNVKPLSKAARSYFENNAAEYMVEWYLHKDTQF